MIRDALFSAALQKILSLLFVRVEEAFHLNEIMRLTGLGSASAQRELRRLHDAGLITSERIGNIRLYRPNKNSPVYPELHGLVQKTFGLTGVLQQALSALPHPPALAFIFGSVAKGQETSASDLDLLLISDELGYGELLGELASAERTLARKISPTLYSMAEFKNRLRDQHHFLTRVLEQPKIFIIGDGDGLKRIEQSLAHPLRETGKRKPTRV
jgi:DNA-binding transcriptional ArsR family regulator/predicted nucleotidyltransferase